MMILVTLSLTHTHQAQRISPTSYSLICAPLLVTKYAIYLALVVTRSRCSCVMSIYSPYTCVRAWVRVFSFMITMQHLGCVCPCTQGQCRELALADFIDAFVIYNIDRPSSTHILVNLVRWRCVPHALVPSRWIDDLSRYPYALVPCSIRLHR